MSLYVCTKTRKGRDDGGTVTDKGDTRNRTTFCGDRRVSGYDLGGPERGVRLMSSLTHGRWNGGTMQRERRRSRGNNGGTDSGNGRGTTQGHGRAPGGGSEMSRRKSRHTGSLTRRTFWMNREGRNVGTYRGITKILLQLLDGKPRGGQRVRLTPRYGDGRLVERQGSVTVQRYTKTL